MAYLAQGVRDLTEKPYFYSIKLNKTLGPEYYCLLLLCNQINKPQNF